MGSGAGRVALVSGASRGIGRACALALAEDGADVVVNYLSHPAEAAGVVQEIERLGRRGLAHRADVSDRAQVDAMVAAALDRFGRLDAVVANAYRSIRQPFLGVSPEGLEQTLAVTLLGAFHVCQAGARAMVERGVAGSITVIGSIHGETGFSNSTSYNIAKFGLTGLVLTAANELAAHGIRVNLVNPGWIDTPGERRYATEEELRAAAQRLPWRRLGQPREIGRVVAFLASDGASFVSGAVLRADGAQIAGLGG
ncbi:MAG TPA: SDR family NAD(P)-dependent oxidoreductase [Chloroflexota bacterium]|jgi:glucose 1-dehydrogenase|nr:SDR family NAD(P)-dependent oxidoreductase [Chloroflexota bacterium]